MIQIRWPAWYDRAPLAFGGDYNPEQWDEAVWAEDMALMGQAGVNLVTVGVFAWAKLQPAADRWEFGWLDKVLDLLAQHHIAVDLATATASPPAWFTRRYPESALVTADGVRLSHGSRQNWCPSSPDYRRASLELVERLADRYGSHEALALWHISNELGCHNSRCYCDWSAASFRNWLQVRYGTLAELNAAWGTAGWSQSYGDWAEILPPRATPTFANPAQRLDFAQFSTDELGAQLAAERAVLQRVTPEVPATTNFMLWWASGQLDYSSWVTQVDIVANDHYTVAADPRRQIDLAMAADASRGIAGGNPWLLLEHSTSAVSWQEVNRAKVPGEMARNTLAHIARGADGALFFQWRASRSGAEKYHSAMVPHAGADSDVFRAVTDLGADLAKLAPVAGSTLYAPVGLIVDFASWVALSGEGLPSDRLDYAAELRAWYEALWDAHLTVDLIPPSADFSRYRLLIAPHWYLMDTAAAGPAAEPSPTAIPSPFPTAVLSPPPTAVPSPSPTPVPSPAGEPGRETTNDSAGQIAEPGQYPITTRPASSAGTATLPTPESSPSPTAIPSPPPTPVPSPAAVPSPVGEPSPAGEPGRALGADPAAGPVSATAPSQPDAVTRLRAYVEAGGQLVTTFFSGIADRHDRVYLGGYPGGLRDLLGIRVEEFMPLLDGETVTLSDGASGSLWAEPVTPLETTVLARYLNGPASGYAAITRTSRGAGSAWYVSTKLDAASLGNLIELVAAEAKVARIEAPADVEIVVRHHRDTKFSFVINHSPTDVGLRFNGRDLLTGDTGPVIVVPAGGVRVIEQPT